MSLSDYESRGMSADEFPSAISMGEESSSGDRRRPYDESAGASGSGSGSGSASTSAGVSLAPSLELLTYYRRRVDEFEKERGVFLAKFKEVEDQGREADRLKWELKVREDEVMELQKALSDANVYLYDERKQVLTLQAENDSLKVQEIEDRRRIQHLLALTQPVTQEVTFFRDCRPEKMTHYPGSAATGGGADKSHDAAGGLAAATSSRACRGGSSSTSGAAAGGSGDSPAQSRVLRTVYLPSERADALLLTVQSLQQQVDSLRKLMDERTEAWRVDREEREKIHRRKLDADSALISTLEKDLSQTKHRLQGTTQEYLTTRHASQVAQRHLREQVAALTAANSKLTKELGETREAAVGEIEQVKLAAKREGQQFREYARQQAQQREDDLRLLKEQYAEVQAMYEARVRGVEAKLSKARARYKTLERRRNLELEGSMTDIATLRRALQQLETQWMVTVEAMAGGEGTDASVPTASFRSSRTVSASRAMADKSRSVLNSGSGSGMGTSTSMSYAQTSSSGTRKGLSSFSDDGSRLSWRVKSSGYGETRPVRRRTKKGGKRGAGPRAAWPPAHHTHHMPRSSRGKMAADDLDSDEEHVGEDGEAEEEAEEEQSEQFLSTSHPMLSGTEPSGASSSSFLRSSTMSGGENMSELTSESAVRRGVDELSARVAALKARVGAGGSMA